MNSESKFAVFDNDYTGRQTFGSISATFVLQ